MPLPKRRHSSTRQAKRRSQWKLKPPTLTQCTRCQAMAKRHHVCPECGYYNGRQWMVPKTRDTAGQDE